MTNLTALERTLLDDLTKDDFWENGLDSGVWVDTFLAYTTEIPAKEARGVLSSLIKKNIIRPIMKGEDGVISLTAYGKEVMIELGYND